MTDYAADLTPDIARAARDIVGMSSDELAEKAGIGAADVRDFEDDTHLLEESEALALRDLLEQLGAVIVETDSLDGEVVRLRQPPVQGGDEVA